MVMEWRACSVGRAGACAAAATVTDRTDFETRNLFDFSPSDWRDFVSRAGAVGKVLIDPPREGALALAQALADTSAGQPRRPDRVVYVSCNPATLARDCNVMVNDGGWILRAAGIVNMFPHTSHVESIALLEPAHAENARAAAAA